MFFKPWQLDALRVLWRTGRGLSSREVWEELGGPKVIRRASVINFLKDAVEKGLLMRDSITARGEEREIFKAACDERGTKEYLKKLFTTRLGQL